LFPRKFVAPRCARHDDPMSNKHIKKVTKSASWFSPWSRCNRKVGEDRSRQHLAPDSRRSRAHPRSPSRSRISADYEIIEVNGFQIKRKKKPKTDEGPATYATPPVVKLNRHAQATPQRTPNVEEYEISAELYNRLTEALHDDLNENSRLLAVCSSVCAAELDEVNKNGDERVSGALEAVFGNFMDGIAAALDDESIQRAPVPDELEGGEDFKVDVASRKLGLQRRLDVLKKEEEEWRELLAKVDAIDLSISGLGAEAAATSGRVDESLAPDEIRGLQRLHESMQKKVTTQVEGVSMVIGNIEQVLERAGERAADAQKNLHARRYRAYNEVGEDAKTLIKAIVRK